MILNNMELYFFEMQSKSKNNININNTDNNNGIYLGTIKMVHKHCSTHNIWLQSLYVHVVQNNVRN